MLPLDQPSQSDAVGAVVADDDQHDLHQDPAVQIQRMSDGFDFAVAAVDAATAIVDGDRQRKR